MRKGVRFRPFLRGGHQERGRRAGTENVPYIVGLGMAAQLAGQHMQEERTQVARLRDKLEQGLLAAIPDCMVNGDPENRLPNTTNIAFKNVDGEAILIVTAGDAKVDNAKFKAAFHTKAKMLTPDEVTEMIGHAIGGVCPFGIKEGVKVYLDESMKRFDSVFPAAGSSNSAIELTCDQLEQVAQNCQGWGDFCTGWA